MEKENLLSGLVINKAFKIHSSLGPGLLESVYEKCLLYELEKSGLNVAKQVEVPLNYEDLYLDVSYRADIIVEDKLIVEIKSVESIIDIHIAQTLTYLKLSKMKLGLILNFNVTNMKLGIKRVIN